MQPGVIHMLVNEGQMKPIQGPDQPVGHCLTSPVYVRSNALNKASQQSIQISTHYTPAHRDSAPLCQMANPSLFLAQHTPQVT